MMKIDFTIIALGFAQAVILIGIKSVLGQIRHINGSVKDTREKYVPKADCHESTNRILESIKATDHNFKSELRQTRANIAVQEKHLRKDWKISLDRVHERIDETFKILVEMFKAERSQNGVSK